MRLILLLLALLLPQTCWAAIGAVAWEVQTGTGASGDDLNGGGFLIGGTGTDYTQGGGQAVRSWLAAGGTHTNNLSITDATPSVVSSATYNFVAADVGNIINLTAGTNVTAGRYLIVSVAANAATLDRDAMGGAPSTDGSGYLGGALSTIAAGLTAMGATGAGDTGQVLYIKAGSGYTITAALSPPDVAGSEATRTRIIGYATTRTDGGRPVITLSGPSLTGITIATGNEGWSISNLDINAASQTTSECVQIDAAFTTFYNCIMRSATGFGVDNNQPSNTFIDCEIHTNGSDGIDSVAAKCVYDNCRIHDNTGIGIDSTTGAQLIRCVIYDNTSDGYEESITGSPITIDQCVFHSNGGDGVNVIGDVPSGSVLICNSVFTGNTAYGINFAGGAETADVRGVRYNAFATSGAYANTSGTIAGWTNSITGNVTLTADVSPYANVGTFDFRPHATSQLRNAGINNTDIGYYQADCPPGGGAFFFQPLDWQKGRSWIVRLFKPQQKPRLASVVVRNEK